MGWKSILKHLIDSKSNKFVQTGKIDVMYSCAFFLVGCVRLEQFNNAWPLKNIPYPSNLHFWYYVIANYVSTGLTHSILIFIVKEQFEW